MLWQSAGKFVFCLETAFTPQLKDASAHSGSSKLVPNFCFRSSTRTAQGDIQLQTNYLWHRASERYLCASSARIPPTVRSLLWTPCDCRFTHRLHKLYLYRGCSIKIFSKSAFRSHLLPAIEKQYLGPGFLRAAIFAWQWLLRFTGFRSYVALPRKKVYFLPNFSSSEKANPQGPTSVAVWQRVIWFTRTLKLGVTQVSQYFAAGQGFQTTSFQYLWSPNQWN